MFPSPKYQMEAAYGNESAELKETIFLLMV
jgi:hypothetical protein